MITFMDMNELKVEGHNKELLKSDLTGCQLLLHMKSDDVFSEYFETLDSQRLKKAWGRNTKGNPLLNCYLIDLIEGGEFLDSKYEAVVLNSEQDEIISWSLVVIDSKDRDPLNYKDRINIKIFGFSSLNLHNFDTPKNEDLYLTSTDDFNLMILDKCSFDTLLHLRRMFELCQTAKVYNSFKADSANSARIQISIDSYEEVIADLRNLRIKEKTNQRNTFFASTKNKYSEITHWQEYNLRMKVRELRREQFKNIREFVELEDLWFDRIKLKIERGEIEIESDKEIVYRGSKIIDRSELADGDVFVLVTREKGLFDGIDRFTLSLAICKVHSHIELSDKKYDQVLYSFEVSLNEEKFDYMNFAAI